MLIIFTTKEAEEIFHWLDVGSGSLWVGDVVFETNEDGGFWIRVPKVMEQ